MTIRLFNTLSNTVEVLEPIDGETLRIYVCGPTVYDYGHIGNFRTFLAARYFAPVPQARGPQVTAGHEHHGCGRQDHPECNGRAFDA